MAELVHLDRSGDWRRRERELEEVAVGVRFARPDPNAGPASWAHWRGNHSEPTPKSVSEMDLDLCQELQDSGRVNLDELMIYHTPDRVLHQGVRIDPSNNKILDIVNDMARGRRALLQLALKEKSTTPKALKISNQVFAEWPAKIQTIQGEVAEAKSRQVQPRYLRIPPLLISKICLIN